MKQLLSLLLTQIFVIHISAQEKPTWSLQTTVMSEYLGRIGSVFDKSPISVNEIGLGYENWYAGLWTATDLGRKHPYGTTYGDEIDFFAGWSHTFNWVRTDLSMSYYSIAQLERLDDDLWVIEPEISFPKFPFIEPYIRVRYFGEVGSGSPHGGMFYFTGLRKKVRVLDLEVSTAYAGGALHDSQGFVYGRLTTTFNIPLSKSWTFSPTAIYQIAAPGQRNSPKGFTDGNKLVFGASLGFKF